jgi:hypothetical protein
MSENLESSVGRVIARVAPGEIGEVRIPFKGGTEIFHAYAWEEGATIEVGTEIVVIERVGPRSVKVSPFTY